MDNPETLATLGIQHYRKLKRRATCTSLKTWSEAMHFL